MGRVIAILLTVVILGVVLYVYSSGIVNRGVSGLEHTFSSSGTPAIFSPFGSTTITGPVAPTSTAFSSGSSGNSASGAGSSTVQINPQDIPAGFTAEQLSPFFHEVKIGGASYGLAPWYGTITLYTNFNNASDTIDVTGWQLKAQRGGEYIPTAIAFYDPSGLTAPTDIRLKNRDTVYLYSSWAPFNLRLNKCVGYLAHVSNFTPQLPANCPWIDRSQISQFTGACQNYIQSIGSCGTPDLTSLRVPSTDYACRDYLENNFSYSSCFNNHRGDPDFLSSQVWVWMGNNIIDQFHDTVTLLDKNGLLVDLYQY